MRVWGSSASKTLRRTAQDCCVYCGHAMEYFDRFDGGRIPLVPVEFPAARVMPRQRWQVDNGVAYLNPGAQGACRLPHPAVCPMAEHTDADRELEDVRRVLAVHTRKAIDTGQFVPREAKDIDETVVAEQHIAVEEGTERHIVRHAVGLWLAPTTVQDLCCVALSQGARCGTAVRAEDDPEGAWEEIDIPSVTGRHGQQVLAAGDTMWVYGLNALDFDALQRWVKQRCPIHWKSTAPDAVAPEWIHFSAMHHDSHILHQRPLDAALPSPRTGDRGPFGIVFEPARTTCANERCRNGTVLAVEEGWLCYKCAPKARRREATHRAWQRGIADD
ncbi:DUF6083 domain-containing protein [Streptomyces sp. NPDC059080]|uniref:DUF6083 domain-containing protein n=1 Tax=Streptomyces sp. NPDC059080 TaxID=3346718 RepID=UPI0036A5B9BD